MKVWGCLSINGTTNSYPPCGRVDAEGITNISLTCDAVSYLALISRIRICCSHSAYNKPLWRPFCDIECHPVRHKGRSVVVDVNNRDIDEGSITRISSVQYSNCQEITGDVFIVKPYFCLQNTTDWQYLEIITRWYGVCDTVLENDVTIRVFSCDLHQ